MPDISQPETVPPIQRRLEGQPQGGGRDTPRGQPSKKVVETYQEVARAKPFDDRVTILGIPVEQITPATHAALAGLVAEINHLRNVVKRHERGSDKRGGQPQSDAAILEPEEFLRLLGATLGQSSGEGMTWITVLVHVSTYEDIRRSSGLLAANSALADVAQRLKELQLNAHSVQPEVLSDAAPAGVSPSLASASATVPFVLVGYAGGSNLAAITALPVAGFDGAEVARVVHEHLTSTGYVVGGIDMALAINTAATPVGVGESPLLALGRADHLLRSS